MPTPMTLICFASACHKPNKIVVNSRRIPDALGCLKQSLLEGFFVLIYVRNTSGGWSGVKSQNSALKWQKNVEMTESKGGRV